MNHRTSSQMAERAWQAAPREAREAVEGALRSTRESIESHPGAAVLSAFGVGLALGAIAAACVACYTMSDTSSHRGWFA